MARASIDEYLMTVALAVASRSDWPGTRVGCVAAIDGHIKSTGYNGTPRKFKQNDWPAYADARALKKFYCHAEENAIVNAARSGTRLEGATFYCTLSPCIPCARMMVNLQVSRVVVRELWKDSDDGAQAIKLLENAGIEVSLPQED